MDNVNAQLSALSAGNEDQKVRFVAGSSDAEKMLSDVVLSYSTDDGPLTMGGDGRNNQIYLSAWLAKQHIKEAPDHVTGRVFSEDFEWTSNNHIAFSTDCASLSSTKHG